MNWIIGGLLIIAMFLAARYTWRQHKKGECAGGCAGCHHCSLDNLPESAAAKESPKAGSDCCGCHPEKR